MTNTMNKKSQLAKLLATENIEVQENKVQTASFDVVNRILTIPIFKDEHTVYSYPEIRSVEDTSEELVNKVSGILELLKKDENDDINYNDTVFAKMIQNYGGAQQIVKFMQINKKLFKNLLLKIVVNKQSKSPKDSAR